ncbi:thiamine-phosphate kinase [Inquilinus sp. CAU 1745]|uniref:thiamine-phosphate kinase n=1 Tax=Inquilinus sp. CAU 1745 TaxID=3140369 RepID=UPI00325AD22A
MPGLGEFQRIDRYFKPLAAGFPGALGLGDDAGLLSPGPGEDLVATTDSMVEGVHYLPGEKPSRLARKLLRVNLSDLAAKGARPLAYMLTTALPRSAEEGWIAAFADGLRQDQERFGIHLLGGDSVSVEGPAVLGITAFGTAPKGRALLRSGARPGDIIHVSGALGDGALGLESLRGRLPDLDPAHRRHLADRYTLPEPRMELGRRLIGVATASMDISDGLPGDLPHICHASGVAARVETARIPLSPAGRAALAADPGLERLALSGGDDYELLFTAPPEAAETLAALALELSLPLTAIGEISAGEGAAFIGPDGAPVGDLKGWTHFQP